jgi:molybdopterin molybdotransferase
MALLAVADALARVLEGAAPTQAETVGLIDARGRVLAAAVTARRTQPPFDSSAMDGYAVRAQDLAKTPAALTVVGESQAGRRYDGALGSGQAVRIFTGAPVPDGADTIVIQEYTERDGDKVIVREGATTGANIRTAGGDFRQGETLLGPGHLLDAGAITLAAAAGHAALSVRRKPRVTILATGDELVEPGGEPGPDQIVSSNSYGLAALVARAGGTAQLLGIAADTREDLAAKISAASGAAIFVTIGGASVGDCDLVRPTLEASGMTLDFWKVAIRPGKPMLFGRMAATRVLGLPGNPVSCLVAARVFLVPLIHRLLGRADSPTRETMALLAADLPANGPRQHYMLAKLDWASAQSPRVTALAKQDSARITGLVAADALIVRAPDAPPARQGDSVRVLPLDL